jgi:hypothetical protein
MSYFTRSSLSGPLLPYRSHFSRIHQKLRALFDVITCTRTSDVVHHHPQHRPPCFNTQHRHHPRPRVEPPPTDQAGGSAWQYQQQGPTSGYQYQPPRPDQAGGSAWQGPTSSYQYQPPRPDQAGGSAWQGPTSGYLYQPPRPDQAGGSAWQYQQDGPPSFHPATQQQGMPLYNYSVQSQLELHLSSILIFHPAGTGNDTPMSGSVWASEADPEDSTHDYMSQPNEWMDMYMTPPPGPTQETQYEEDGSEIPLRQFRAPQRYGWTTPTSLPERRPRRRQ